MISGSNAVQLRSVCLGWAGMMAAFRAVFGLTPVAFPFLAPAFSPI